MNESDARPLQVFTKRGLTCFAVRVQPRSSRDRVIGLNQGVLRVQLTAPAVEDRANRRLLKFLARQLGVRSHRLHLLSGRKSRLKTVGVEALSARKLLSRLQG